MDFNLSDLSHYFTRGGLLPYNSLYDDEELEIIEKEVKGMLPSNKLGRRMYSHLKVYSGPNHPHEAQSPKPLEI